MKLNLLPPYVKLGELRKKYALLMIILFVIVNAGFGIWWFNVAKYNEELNITKEEKLRKVNEVVALSDSADKILQNAILLLAQTWVVEAIKDYNNLYADTYYYLASYIPSGVRINKMTVEKTSDSGGPMLTIEANIKDLTQLAQVLSAFYNCEYVSKTGIDDIKGNKVSFPEGDDSASSYAGGGGASSPMMPGAPMGGPMASPMAGGMGGSFGSSGDASTSGISKIEPVLPGYNTYVIKCSLTKPQFIAPNVITVLKAIGQPPASQSTGSASTGSAAPGMAPGASPAAAPAAPGMAPMAR